MFQGGPIATIIECNFVPDNLMNNPIDIIQ